MLQVAFHLNNFTYFKLAELALFIKLKGLEAIQSYRTAKITRLEAELEKITRRQA